VIKRAASVATAFISPQCRYDRALFVIGHMRCGSTALSHILCSHPDVSGYGEAHICYDGTSALGLLVLNQLRRKAHRANAHFLFDKILHSRYHNSVGSEFCNARAIFMVREPVETIRSIRKLFLTIGSTEYASDALAANYYEERITTLIESWERFSPERRIGMTYSQLTSDPETQIARISKMLGLCPPLANKYVKPLRRMGHGSGDPLASHNFDRIVSSRLSSTLVDEAAPLKLSAAWLERLRSLYDHASITVTHLQLKSG
jgi:Sulfotransferase family